MRRGDIYYADLRPVIGSEQGGIRPVLIIQNDVGNKHSPTVICAAITSKMNKAKLPTHIALSSAVYALPKDSVVLLEPIRTLDKQRLREMPAGRRHYAESEPGTESQPGAGYIARCIVYPKIG